MSEIQTALLPPAVLFVGGVAEWPHVREACLTNLEDIRLACPAEFRDRANPWRRYVRSVEYWMGDRNGVNHWVWKSQDEALQQEQLTQWRFLIDGRAGIPFEEMRAVSAWMLSEMLTEVPEFTAPEIHM